MRPSCLACHSNPACMKRPKNGDALCKSCFFAAFEREVHQVISDSSLFRAGMRVGIGASGGKDSTVLASLMRTLNDRHRYGLELQLVSIDEGISGYRDDSLATVRRNATDEQYSMPLTVLSYRQLYGWTMDEIVEQIGLKNNCTFCGVFRRQALDRAAIRLRLDMIVTGHNADDVAETILMNMLRGDVARLSRCTSIVTGADTAAELEESGAEVMVVPRAKPLKYAYEKEIVLYAHYKQLDYFSTECTYSPNSYRGYVRSYLKDMERIRPRSILDIIKSGEEFRLRSQVSGRLPERRTCRQCGYISSQELCKACVLLDGLNRGLPKLAVGGKTQRINRRIVEPALRDLE